MLRYFVVYARTSPGQKEHIVISLRQAGLETLMCGDGTNDVGALKKADIGIALVGLKEEDFKELQRRKKEQKEKQKKMQQKP